MNIHVKSWALRGEKAKAAIIHELYKATGVAPPGKSESPKDLAQLPVWQRTSTARYTREEVRPTGAAILFKNPTPRDELPFVHGWKGVIREIAGGKPQVACFLREVVVWHHYSTDGRFNEALGRFERWGAQTIEKWCAAIASETGKSISESTFRRMVRALQQRGLIVSEVHLRFNTTCVWIKPSDTLSRILFDPSHWETVKDAYAIPKKPRPEKPKSARKPRGLSAIYRQLEIQQRDLYRQLLAHELTRDEGLAAIAALSKPTLITPKYTKPAYAPEGSPRHKRMLNRLASW